MTNAEFLERIFGTPPAGETVAVCAFQMPPEDRAAMGKGWPVWHPTDNNIKALVNGSRAANCYFCVSTVRDQDHLHRGIDDLIALYLVPLDDIGTGTGAKRSPDELPTPTYRIETSAGNFQYGYVLKEPLRDIDVAAAIVSAVTKAGEADTAAALAGKLIRLPNGINNKRKYPVPWTVRLDDFTGPRYSVEELMAAFHIETLDVKSRADGGHGGEHTASGELYDALVVRGLAGPVGADGFCTIECPQAADHTPGTGITARFSPIGCGGEYADSRQFKCFHSHGAIDADMVAAMVGIRLHDPRTAMFRRLMNRANAYVYLPTRDIWGAEAVNTKLPFVMQIGERSDGTPIWVKPATWISLRQQIVQLTWLPSDQIEFHDVIVTDGGWQKKPGDSVLNVYRPPAYVKRGGATATDVRAAADLWMQHGERLYPGRWQHAVNYLAYKAQHPGVKINHAIVMGGEEGIGKDTLFEPVKRAVGPWNCDEVSPATLMGRFNGYVRKVMLRISEARDQDKETDRFALYDHTKTLIAAPPDVIRVDEKYLPETLVFNIVGVIYTTNYKTTGIYLPRADRRHYVMWSDSTKDMFKAEYWNKFWNWYDSGGLDAVAEYLLTLDVSAFDPKAEPPQTDAWREIVDANMAPEDAEIADLLDAMKRPDAMTIEMLAAHPACKHELKDFLTARGLRRQVPHRMETAGYVRVLNPTAKDGYWPVDGRRVAYYGKKEMSASQRHNAVAALLAAAEEKKAKKAKAAAVALAGQKSV